MTRPAIGSNCTPSEALRRWLELAVSHDVYIDLTYAFSGIVGEQDSLPPQLADPLDEWMRDLIQQCRAEEQEERWIRLKFTQQAHTLWLECEAAGRLPDVQKLQNTGVHLEIENMGESYWLALEIGLTKQIRIAVCCAAPEREVFRQGIDHYAAEQKAPIQTEIFEQAQDFYKALEQNSLWDLIVVAIPGAAGMETVIGARTLANVAPLLWCSDDSGFAVESYRQRCSLFLVMPMAPEDVKAAIGRCLEQKPACTGPLPTGT